MVEICKNVFSMSEVKAIGNNQNTNKISHSDWVKFGPLYKQSFKLCSEGEDFDDALKTILNFVVSLSLLIIGGK